MIDPKVPLQLGNEIDELREKVAQLEDYKAKTGLAYKGSEQETRDKLAAAQATIAQMREANAELLEGLEIAVIGACAVGVPHPGERKVLQECVTNIRDLIAKHGGK